MIILSKDCRNHYHISILVEYYIEELQTPSNSILGLDYSEQNFYVSSEGERANYPRYYRKLEEKLRLEQQSLSNKVLRSKNWIKQKKKISKIQNKITCQRLDWLHKESYKLAENYDAVIVEDINLRGMAQTLKLAKNLSDNGFGMFRSLLKYKLEERGKQFIKIDKWYPSSKICSNCKNKNNTLALSDRVYKCDHCGLSIDRDYNASLNIREVGSTLLAW
jgi:putative transposase